MRNRPFQHIRHLLLCAIVFIACLHKTHAQNKQGNIWYFGYYAGLDFNTSPPTPLDDGELHTWEGCATLADKDGNLLFYTDGIKVWNKEHDVMPNGSGLKGDPSSTQSGVIVPFPGNENLYYIFTVSNYGLSMDYSVVDITLEGGLGDVTEKNINLLQRGTEKIAATSHANGQDIWLLTHKFNSSEFYLWLITKEGISSTPIIQEVGSRHSGTNSNAIGYLKFSASSSKIALAAFWQLDFVETFSFDNSTGTIELESKTTGFEAEGPYGIEFSPNEKYLYISERQYSGLTSLFQVPLSDANGEISQKGFLVAKDHSFGALQLGPDRKIYVARDRSKHLGIINNPNEHQADVNFVLDGIELADRSSNSWNWNITSALGLPNLIQSLFNPLDFNASSLCPNLPTQFAALYDELDQVDSLLWDFGDGITSTQQDPTHVYNSPGDYLVKIKVYQDGDSINNARSITINEAPILSLESGTLIVQNSPKQFSVPSHNQSYLWHDGDTNTSKTISTAGWHWLEAINDAGCTKRDSLASFKLAYTDTCQLNPTQFEIDTGNISVDSVRWNFNDPQDGTPGSSLNQTHVFQQAGQYSIQVDLYYHGELLTEQFAVEIAALPPVDLGADQTLLYGESLDLDVTHTGESFLWQDGSTSGQYTVTHPGIYWVEVQNANGCIKRDSIQISYDQIIDVSLPADTTLCLGERLNLDVSLPEASYEWQDGSANAEYTVAEAGIYWVKITNAYQNRTKTDSIIVDYYQFNELSADSEIVLCETSNAILRASGARATETYRWYDENMTLLEENAGEFITTELKESTDFFVTLTNGICESPPVRVPVIYDKVFAEIIASDTIVKLGDSIELFGLGGDAYVWSPAEWLDNANNQNVTSSPLDDITYTLTAISMRGCRATASIDILVEKQIEITNVFTPNGDGLNDFWEVRFIDRFPNNVVQIFDRGGILLYEVTNYKNDWDGTYKGNSLPEGTYFYKINLNDRTYPIQKGSLTILKND